MLHFVHLMLLYSNDFLRKSMKFECVKLRKLICSEAVPVSNEGQNTF